MINDVLGVPGRGTGTGSGEALAVLNRGFARQRDTDRSAVQAANDAAQQMLSYFARSFSTSAPQRQLDDLMSALASRHADGEDQPGPGWLTASSSSNAGHQTTTALLALGTHLLVHPPRGAGRPAEKSGRWPAAVEEMLRLITPTTFTGATPRTDADIHGVTCPAGQPRLLFLAAANRDPSVFPDPDRFDISRGPQPAPQLFRRRTLLPGRPHRQDARRSLAEHPVHPASWAGRPLPRPTPPPASPRARSTTSPSPGSTTGRDARGG